MAVFVVHEFISSKTSSAKVNRNNADFEKFIRSFPEMSGTTVAAGKLIEGINVPGGQYVPHDIPILIGKVTSNLGW